MGLYINKTRKQSVLPAKGKVQHLVDDGAKIIKGTPQSFEKDLVCVVDNGIFEAAAYIFSENEFDAFKKMMEELKLG